jgi:hypothetical protein
VQLPAAVGARDEGLQLEQVVLLLVELLLLHVTVEKRRENGQTKYSRDC